MFRCVASKIDRVTADFGRERDIISVHIGRTALADISLKPYCQRVFFKPYIELIDTIHEELLKSCELTGIWEKKLRDIEHKTYDPAEFINGLKEQINQIVIDVLSDNSSRRVTIMTEEDLKKKPEKKKTAAKKAETKKAETKKKDAATQDAAQPASTSQTPADPMVGKPCPLCGKGVIIKGKTAYGCSNWKSGCQYRQPFSQM